MVDLQECLRVVRGFIKVLFSPIEGGESLVALPKMIER